MKAVMVDVPEHLLAQRRSAGADRWDEMWEGVLHTVPPPSGRHQRFGMRLAHLLDALARERGLVGSYETGLFRPGTDDDYRVPDQVYARPELLTERGVDGPAELVVEIRSPGDETYDKLAFYAAVGVPEVLVAHPGEGRVELFVLRGDRHVLVQPDEKGEIGVGALGARLSAVPGPSLRVSWSAGSSEV
ncbi:MAG: Uma2 family endonuclease [Acidimicrobiales bacterium]